MAKVKTRPGLLDEAPAEEMVEAQGPEPMPRWKVSLGCPTLIPFPTLEVEGHNEDEARAAFCKANGISASVHPWTVVRVN